MTAYNEVDYIFCQEVQISVTACHLQMNSARVNYGGKRLSIRR